MGTLPEQTTLTKPCGNFLIASMIEMFGEAFALPLGHKDVSLALRAADEWKVPLPLASLLRDHFLASMAKGRESWDWGGMAALLRENAGLPPRRS